MVLIITLKVSPCSGRQKCVIDKNGTLKCYLKSPAQQGKANDELITMFAKALKIKRTAIALTSGQTSRTKKIVINTSMSYVQFLAALEIEHQMKLD